MKNLPLVFVVFVTVFFGVLFIGCGGGDSSNSCTPGAVQSCPCGGGASDGTQTCQEDGTWDVCECEESDSDTDTDTDSDSDSDSDSDTDSDTDSDADTDSDTDSDADTNSDTGTDTDTDTDTDIDTDSDCPEGSGWPCKCTDTCDDGSKCTYLNELGDDNGRFCSASCNGDLDCVQEVCLATGTCLLTTEEEGDYCALVCLSDEGCPPGQTCQKIEVGDLSICHP